MASIGGLEKQYQLKLFPPLLAEAGISLKQVVTTLQNAFQEVGGRTIEVANRRAVPVNVEVQERLPTLREREDEIQLDLAAVDPPWAAFEPEDYPLKGGHRWQVQVPAAHD